MSAVSLRRWLVTVAMLVVPVVASADVVTEWNEKALASATAAKQLTFVITRTIAIVHTAMFDAVNAIEGRYTPYKVKVSAPPGTSPEAAAVAAAHAALVRLFPDQQAALDAAYTASLAHIADGSGKAAGIAVGEQVAADILALRAADGANAPNTYKPSTAPGVYVPTTPPVASNWGSVTPWVMERGAQVRPDAPPPLASQAWARNYNEIKDLGSKKSTLRTAEQTDIARCWTVTGPASWDPVVRQLAAAPGRSVLENARFSR